MRQFATFVFSAAVLLGAAGTAHASSIAFDLNCVLGAGGSAQCGGSVPNYGTVTFDDSPGSGDILLTVNLVGTGGKFKDLFFNYEGSALKITAGNDDIDLLDSGALGHTPYTGKFDVGPLGGNDGYSVILYGWNSASANLGTFDTGGDANVALTLENFQVLDDLGHTFVALHLQNIYCDAGDPFCTPGSTGNGAINAVGSGPSTADADVQADVVPEPASMLLLATGLVGAARSLRRRR